MHQWVGQIKAEVKWSIIVVLFVEGVAVVELVLFRLVLIAWHSLYFLLD